MTRETTFNPRRALHRAGCVVFAVVLIIGGVLYCQHTKKPTVEQVERWIAEELPEVYGKEEAIAWFESRGYWYQETEKKEGKSWIGQRGKKTFAQIAGLNEGELSYAVWSWISPANVHWLFSGRIEVIFFFDKKGRLAGSW